MDNNNERDQQLWTLAKKRAGFKRHLATYIVINIFLWILWALTGRDDSYSKIPWPLWTTVGWGIGLIFHYIGAYVSTGDTSVEREYQKLKNKQ